MKKKIIGSTFDSFLWEKGRVYGGGLHKLEPKELVNVPVPEITDLLPMIPGATIKPKCF